MLKFWTKILPFFFIEWYSRKHCEIMRINSTDFVSPYRGVLIRKQK